MIQHNFQSLAHPARKHRRGATGGNRDQQWCAIHNRRHMETRQGSIVDDVDQDTSCRRRDGDPAVHDRIVGCGDHQPDVIQPCLTKFALQVNDASLRRASGELLRQLRRTHTDTRTCREQGRGLARSHVTATYHEDAAIGQISE